MRDGKHALVFSFYIYLIIVRFGIYVMFWRVTKYGYKNEKATADAGASPIAIGVKRPLICSEPGMSIIPCNPSLFEFDYIRVASFHLGKAHQCDERPKQVASHKD